MLVALILPAHAALPCASLDAEVCEAVNGIVSAVNAEHGTNLLRESSSRAAFRPSKIYSTLLAVKSGASAGGCAITGWGGGLYDANAGAQSWDGRVGDLGGPTDDASGVVTLTPPVWSGAAGPREIGLDVGLHNASGQIAADVDDDGFMAGTWSRLVGSTGVWMTLLGTCPGSTDAGDVLDPWFIGDLPAFGGGSFTVTQSTTDAPAGFSDSTPVCMDLVVPPNGAVVAGGLSITVSLEHPWIGDATLALVHPSGAEATLMQEPPDFNGTAGNSADAVPTGLLHFVDGAATSHNDIGSADPACPANTTCSFSPLDPLSAFTGLAADGVWRICASDGFAAFDPGVLHGATLTFTAE